MMKTRCKRFLGMVIAVMIGCMIVGCEEESYYGEGSSTKETIYYIDGNKIRKEYEYGDVVYYIDGNKIRKEYKYGDVVYYIDGNKIRKEYEYGDVVYYIDGNKIRK